MAEGAADGGTQPFRRPDASDAEAPWFATGGERTASVTGEELGTVCDSTGRAGGACVANWMSPGGGLEHLQMPNGVLPIRSTWDRTGQTVVFTSSDRDRSALYAIDRSSRQTVRKLSVPPGTDLRITGMIDGAAIVMLDDGDSIAVALDGSGTFGGRHPGTLALVIP